MCYQEDGMMEYWNNGIGGKEILQEMIPPMKREEN
jgi:hypothetical protein